MVAGQSRSPFWDRDTDREGRVIRADVRSAAQEVWEKARRMACSVLGDPTDAAEIMEACVARVSRYMDARNQGLFTQRTNALLLVAFRNALFSLAKKRRRLQTIGHASAVDHYLQDCRWAREFELQLDLKTLVRQLSPRSRAILTLRQAGYEWQDVAGLLGITASNAKSGFWREIRQLQSKIVMMRPTKSERSVCLRPAKDSPSDSTRDRTVHFATGSAARSSAVIPGRGEGPRRDQHTRRINAYGC